ncbi:MAG: hypothetical protein M3083_15055 [Actinomycetota bacterium]|nr:hypothetical protein [Actinomycetota bacterium]
MVAGRVVGRRSGRVMGGVFSPAVPPRRNGSPPLRTWLWGLDHGRLALVLDFTRPPVAQAWERWLGNVIDADLTRFPGSAQLRGLVAERRGGAHAGGPPPSWPDLGQVADAWDERWPSIRGWTGGPCR